MLELAKISLCNMNHKENNRWYVNGVRSVYKPAQVPYFQPLHQTVFLESINVAEFITKRG